jgi:hypothetical protein
MFVTLPALLTTLAVQRGAQTWLQTTLIIVSVVAFARSYRGREPLYPWQPDVKASQRLIEGRIPAQELIGCFNAGIPMFFGAGRVVALDGLVSHRARAYWSERRLDEFLRMSGVAYIADEQRAMNRALRFVHTRPELEPLASYPLTGWPTHERILWQVRWPPTTSEP